MTAWQPIPTVNEPHYLDTNLNQIQKCVNWYHEKTPAGLVLMSLQGYQTKGTVANNAASRGSHMDPTTGFLFSVNGNTVYGVDINGSSVAIGTIGSSSGPVVFASGGPFSSGGYGIVMLVDGAHGYVVNILAGTIAQIVDANFPSAPISCACFNGQYIVVNGNTDRWYMSAVDDATTWTPIISGRAITTGDTLFHVEVVRDVVYFMGRYSIEVWSASTVDPYLQPITGATIPVGIFSSKSVSRVRESILFYGIGARARGSIFMISGGQFSEVAPAYVSDKISDWVSGSDRCYAYTNQGVDFFEFYNQSASTFAAWCFNITRGTWSEISSTRAISSVANGFVSGHAPPVAFSNSNGSVFWLGDNASPYNSFDGTAITRVLDFKVDGGVSRTFCAGLRFEFEVQHDSSSSFTLSATLQKSDDGGRTFDTGITLSKAVTNGTSAQQVILQSPPTGSFKAGRIYRLTFAGPAARLILRRAEGLVRVGRF